MRGVGVRQAGDIVRILICLAVALLGANTASAQTAPQPDPYLIVMAGTLRFEQDSAQVPEQAGRGDSVISMPVTHLRTGVLQNDLRFRTGLANYLDAGAPGFYAGEFATADAPVPGPMWCFARRVDDLEAGTRCILSYGSAWVAAGEPTNMYFPVSAQVSQSPSPLPVPEIEEREMSVNPALTADYVFRGWGRNHADAQLQLGGRPLLAVGVFKRIQREADGSALLWTPYGVVRLEQVGSDRGRANVTLLTPE